MVLLCACVRLTDRLLYLGWNRKLGCTGESKTLGIAVNAFPQIKSCLTAEVYKRGPGQWGFLPLPV